MKRRNFIGLLVSLVVVRPEGARPQQTASGPNIPKIGILWGPDKILGDGLVQALARLGYIDGKTVRITDKFPKLDPADIRRQLRELVDQQVDVIVSVPGRGAIEAKKLTTSIPIVVVFANDAVALGLAESLAHPGGNVTGLSLMTEDLHGKRLSLFKEAVPTLRRITLLFDPGISFYERFVDAQLNAAKDLGIPLRLVGTATPDDIEKAFSSLANDGTEGVTFSAGPLMSNQSARIGAIALAYRIPAMGYQPGMARSGLLIAYGQDFADYPAKAATYVDKILKGANPADLPVEQPTQLKLAINLRTAKALGLAIPASLIVAADEVIE
ncbi:MAG: hypothetical protein GY844_28815 [Bradyrhizobium sp.]|nr:hypothetical protein [Bradyrhizobium sp.]